MSEFICPIAHKCFKRLSCFHAKLHQFDKKENCSGRGCEVGEVLKFIACIPYKNRTFEVGDIVIFADNHSGYSIGKSNPVYGSKYFCNGIVDTVHNDTSLSVTWSNGETNGYNNHDLHHEFIFITSILKGEPTKLNPNILFQMRKYTSGKR